MSSEHSALYLTLGDLLLIQITLDHPWVTNRLPLYSDALTTLPRHDAGTFSPDLTIIYRDRCNLSAGRSLAPDAVSYGTTLKDTKYRVSLSPSPAGGIQLTTVDEALEWIEWSFQLALLSKGYTFVHAAGAVGPNGTAVLLPSWGGVGKTAILGHLVQREGWRLLGDDLVILGAAGQCYPFPKPMFIYPYHRPVFPDLFDDRLGPKAPRPVLPLLSHIVQPAKRALRSSPSLLSWARRHNPQSAQVRPTQVFGASSIAGSAPLERIYWLEPRPDLQAPRVCDGDPSDLPSRLFGSTVSQFDRRCVALTNYSHGLGAIRLRDTYPSWGAVLDAALGSAATSCIQMPVSGDLWHHTMTVAQKVATS